MGSGIDLHTHSNVSDGTDSPSQLVAKAADAGLSVLALTDHDTFDGLAEAREAARQHGVELIDGIEISTSLDGVSVHLLGYGCDPGNAALAEELTRLRSSRTDRLPRQLDRLAELGMPLEVAEVERFVGDSPSIGRPHVADAMVARGYVESRNEAFATWLSDEGPAYVPRYSTRLTRGIELVTAAGGVAVIAHPWGRGSRRVLTPERLTQLVREHGLHGFEVDHFDHGPTDSPDRRELRGLADSLQVLGTGSSDYHGTGKTFPLGGNTTDPAVLARLRSLSPHL